MKHFFILNVILYGFCVHIWQTFMLRDSFSSFTLFISMIYKINIATVPTEVYDCSEIFIKEAKMNQINGVYIQELFS